MYVSVWIKVSCNCIFRIGIGFGNVISLVMEMSSFDRRLFLLSLIMGSKSICLGNGSSSMMMVGLSFSIGKGLCRNWCSIG